MKMSALTQLAGMIAVGLSGACTRSGADGAPACAADTKPVAAAQTLTQSTPKSIANEVSAPGKLTGYDPTGTVKPPSQKPPDPDAVTPPPPSAPAPTYTPVPWPNIGFVDYASSLGKKVVALTFDDGPDGVGNDGENNTGAVLAL